MCSYEMLCMADIILYFEVYANDKNLANLNVLLINILGFFRPRQHKQEISNNSILGLGNIHKSFQTIAF